MEFLLFILETITVSRFLFTFHNSLIVWKFSNIKYLELLMKMFQEFSFNYFGKKLISSFFSWESSLQSRLDSRRSFTDDAVATTFNTRLNDYRCLFKSSLGVEWSWFCQSFTVNIVIGHQWMNETCSNGRCMSTTESDHFENCRCNQTLKNWNSNHVRSGSQSFATLALIWSFLLGVLVRNHHLSISINKK